MSRYLFGFVLLIMTVVPSFPIRVNTAAALQTAAAEDEILQLERDWDEALRLRNAHALNRILADTYTLVDESDVVWTKADYLMSVVKTSDRGRIGPSASEDLTVVVTGDSATVTGRSALKGRPRGRAQLAATYQFSDTWIKVGGAWQARSTTVVYQMR
jgi:ketosteroid isomerase-like protein